MFANALQVAPMSQTGLRAVANIVVHAFYLVVLGVAVGKSIGHEHVQHISIGESHALVATHLTLLQLVFHLFCFLSLGERQRDSAWLGILQVEVSQQIMCVGHLYHAVYLHASITGGYLSAVQVVAVHHELQTRILHPNKPIGCVNAINLYLRIRCERQTQKKHDKYRFLHTMFI